MAVNPSLHVAFKYQCGELVLKAGHAGIEGRGHALQAGALVRTEILDESSAPYPAVESVDMRREVHIEHERILDLVQELQTKSVLGLVKFEDDVSEHRLQLEELLEGAAHDHSLVELLSGEGSKGAQPAIDGDVPGRQHVTIFTRIYLRFQEMFGGGFVFAGGKRCKTCGAVQFGLNDRVLVLGGTAGQRSGFRGIVAFVSALGLDDVTEHVGPVLQIYGHFYHVEAHLEDVHV